MIKNDIKITDIQIYSQPDHKLLVVQAWESYFYMSINHKILFDTNKENYSASFTENRPWMQLLNKNSNISYYLTQITKEELVELLI
jgi:hypothetical protein